MKKTITLIHDLFSAQIDNVRADTKRTKMLTKSIQREIVDNSTKSRAILGVFGATVALCAHRVLARLLGRAEDLAGSTITSVAGGDASSPSTSTTSTTSVAGGDASSPSTSTTSTTIGAEGDASSPSTSTTSTTIGAEGDTWNTSTTTNPIYMTDHIGLKKSSQVDIASFLLTNVPLCMDLIESFASDYGQLKKVEVHCEALRKFFQDPE